MTKFLARVFGKGVFEASIRELTGHMFDHFLSGTLALFVAGKISVESVLLLIVIVALFVLIVRVAHLQEEEIDGNSKK